ncbi:NTP/NDP exchange transporter [Pseudoxanthomonas dokdonensis]|uniref:ADP/ATP translocating protein n=1 Tax=Pseudoxanthomonas dokdonensis TaxID=344882 RepID=A0A0R0CY94_9GAMM|nr:MFS transporter [Pseudoxanthomonas dokdonensis]KRG71111.1 ADP/ATP translocating protein [Pseudoxanthomonas dokdonensis]
MAPAPHRAGWLARTFDLEAGETAPVLAGMLMFFLLFAGYFMLRPVRETMGVAGGVEQLQWLFTGTFVATLVTLPLFGWLAGKVSRRRILPWTYGFFVFNLLLFVVAFQQRPDDVWLARVFYIWLSVFNLLSISLAWSVLADLFAASQARRLFALMAGGASLGGLVGPLLGTLLVAPIGHAGLMLLSALLLAGSAAAAIWLQHWRDRCPLPQDASLPRSRPLGGNPFAGASAVLRSPYLMGIALFVVLLASVTTFLYFEQARLVADTFPDRTRQTQVFGTIDTVVQSLSILAQLFITGRVARRFGVGLLLVSVPLVAMLGFLWLALAPTFAVLAVVMVARRAGEYAFARPGREMLYTVVDPEAKYKAKNFIDTVVYRGADALSGWIKRLLDVVAEHPALAMLIGSAIALVWALTGGWLGRAQQRRERQQAIPR